MNNKIMQPRRQNSTCSSKYDAGERIATVNDRIQDLIRMIVEDDQSFVIFDVDGDMPLGLRVHHSERDAYLRTAMRRSVGTVVRPARSVRFACDKDRDAQMFAASLLARLGRIARKPIARSVVERVLSVSAADCIRWTKAGLLRPMGSAMSGRGATAVWIPTYSPILIERLIGRDDLILDWRNVQSG